MNARRRPSGDHSGHELCTVPLVSARAGAAVVQLYLRVNTTGLTRPAQQLGGFARVDLGAGSGAG